MDKCDYDDLGNSLLKGVGRGTKKSVMADHTLRDYDMQPPERVTRHAARRKKERGTRGPLAPRYVRGTQRSVVATYTPTNSVHRIKLWLAVSAGKLIGSKGVRIKALQDETKTKMRVEHGAVYVRGTKKACRRAKQLLEDQGFTK